MIEPQDFRVLLVYPNLSMMLTPSYAVALFTAVLKAQGYDLQLFDCTPYLATYEYLRELETMIKRYAPEFLYINDEADRMLTYAG